MDTKAPLGWLIERERMAEEFKLEWDHWLGNNVTPVSMEYLKDRNRGMILLFLYKILRSENEAYIPILTLWERNEYKKVQAEIRRVIVALEQRKHMDDAVWERLIRERSESLLVRSKEPILLVCKDCDMFIIVTGAEPEMYTEDGLKLPERCERCSERERSERNVFRTNLKS